MDHYSLVKKAASNPCDGIIGGIAGSGSVELQFQDKQHRDLFNRNTPGHLDTAYIRGFNKGVVLVPAQYNKGYPGITTLIVPTGADLSFYLKLSETDIDTVYSNIKTTPNSNCTFSTQLTALKYNNISFTDSVGRAKLFTVIK